MEIFTSKVMKYWNGHIKAFKTSGKANFYTAGGHISVTDSDCEATLRSDGGNLWITNVSGALKGDTKGGKELSNTSSNAISG